MKYLLFLFFSVFVLDIHAQECCPDANQEHSISNTATQRDYQLLLSHNWERSLQKKSIGYFLKKYNIRYRKYEIITYRNRNLTGISFDLGKGLEISFSINRFRYVSATRPRGGWLLSEVIKEQFFQARIMYDGQCLKCYQ